MRACRPVSSCCPLKIFASWPSTERDHTFKFIKKREPKVPVKRRTSHEPNPMTVWVDSNNYKERLSESNATSFPGSLIFPKRDPGLRWSRVFQILADSTDVLEGRGWKVKVCLALSLSTEPGRQWNLQRSRCVDRQKSQRRHWHIRCRSSIHSMFG